MAASVSLPQSEMCWVSRQRKTKSIFHGNWNNVLSVTNDTVPWNALWHKTKEIEIFHSHFHFSCNCSRMPKPFWHPTLYRQPLSQSKSVGHNLREVKTADRNAETMSVLPFVWDFLTFFTRLSCHMSWNWKWLFFSWSKNRADNNFGNLTLTIFSLHVK